MDTLIINSDGGARGNPGPAGIGAVLKTPNGKIIKEISEYIGETTNNQAEYKALIAGLNYAKSINAKRLTCNLDSELIVRQLNGHYKVKNEGLKPLFLKVIEMVNDFENITFNYIPRSKNIEADKLVNIALNKNI